MESSEFQNNLQATTSYQHVPGDHPDMDEMFMPIFYILIVGLLGVFGGIVLLVGLYKRFIKKTSSE